MDQKSGAAQEQPVLGVIRLALGAKAIPDGGLAQDRLRVDLMDQAMPDEVWIGELVVLGALPWKPGQERKVEVRIMSEEFKEQVVSQRLTLLVARGGETIGVLELE